MMKLSGHECFFLLTHAACEILVPQPGIKPMPPAIAAWSLNHCTTREVLRIFLDYDVYAKVSTGKSEQHAETDR